MALRVDKLERRLDTAEGELSELASRAKRGQLRHTAPAPGPGPSSGYGSTMPGFSESRAHSHAPTPIITRPAPPSQYRTQGHPQTPHGYLQQPPQSAAHPPKKVGSSENAGYLPFVMEKIASESEKKRPGELRTWQVHSCVQCLFLADILQSACGRPTFDIGCFREHHFDWCYLHQRPFIPGSDSCGRSDRRGCQPIRWGE